MSSVTLTDKLDELKLSQIGHTPKPVNGRRVAELLAKPTPRSPIIDNPNLVGDWEADAEAYTGPQLAQRSMDVPTFYGPEKLDIALRSAYDKVDNPDGIINLGLAENSLLTTEYLDYYGRVLKDALTPVDLTYGNRASGSARLTRAIANMWNENFSPVQPVQPEDLVMGPGASSVLDQLATALCNPGEGIMIAAPHYNGFDVNMRCRSRVEVIHVDVPNPDDGGFSASAMDAFERSLAETRARGVVVRAVLLCNPQNPWGRTYDREALLAYALFCEKHDLHLISDEIYALSTYENPNLPDAPPFISFLALDVEKETGQKFDKSRLHIVYSFSKDFGINGFRIACIITPFNRLLRRVLLHTSFLYKVSSPADALVSALLNDKATFQKMTTLNRQRLADNAAYMRDWFEKRGCYPLQASAGHFMMVDARDALGVSTFEQERDLGRRCAAFGVFVGIGGAYNYHTPGWLRVTFSMPEDTLKIALGRLEQALELHVKA